VRSTNVSLPRNLIGSETLPLPIYDVEMLPREKEQRENRRKGKPPPMAVIPNHPLCVLCVFVVHFIFFPELITLFDRKIHLFLRRINHVSLGDFFSLAPYVKGYFPLDFCFCFSYEIQRLKYATRFLRFLECVGQKTQIRG
jgi:hypothetical protein